MKFRSLPIALLFAIVALCPTAASAHDDRLGLSSDGVTFARTLDEPLFNSATRWVPGDVRVATFFVRNQAERAGNLRVALRRVMRDDLIQTNWLRVSARTGSSPYTSVSTDGMATLVEDVLLQRGDVIPVRVRVELLRDAPNETQVLSSDLDLLVRLSDALALPLAMPGGLGVSPDQAAGTPPGAVAGLTEPTGSRGSLGILPDTGNPLNWWTVPLALLLVVTGAILALWRRNECEGTQS